MVIDFKNDIGNFAQGDKKNIERESIDFIFNKESLMNMLGGK